MSWIKGEASEGLKNFFTKNLGKKFFALVFALALWLTANTEPNIERNVSVDIVYANLPNDLVITNRPPEDLNIRARGPRNRLTSLSPRDMGFSVDLSQVSVGVSRFEIQTEQIKSPREIQVVGISPAEIELDIDRLVEKKVAVQPIVGLPDTGYKIVGEPDVTPREVTLRGPERVVSQVETVPTDLVSTTGVNSKFEIEVPIRPPPHIEIIGDDTVRVSVDIEERMVVKEFKNVDINLINFDNIDFEHPGPLKAELEFEGPYSMIKNLKSSDIKAFVDGSNLANNNEKSVHKLQVSVNYPYRDSIILKRKVPDRIEIRLKE